MLQFHINRFCVWIIRWDKLCVCVCVRARHNQSNIWIFKSRCEFGVFTSVHINLNGNCFFHIVEWKCEFSFLALPVSLSATHWSTHRQFNIYRRRRISLFNKYTRRITNNEWTPETLYYGNVVEKLSSTPRQGPTLDYSWCWNCEIVCYLFFMSHSSRNSSRLVSSQKTSCLRRFSMVLDILCGNKCDRCTPISQHIIQCNCSIFLLTYEISRFFERLSIVDCRVSWFICFFLIRMTLERFLWIVLSTYFWRPSIHKSFLRHPFHFLYIACKFAQSKLIASHPYLIMVVQLIVCSLLLCILMTSPSVTISIGHFVIFKGLRLPWM